MQTYKFIIFLLCSYISGKYVKIQKNILQSMLKIIFITMLSFFEILARLVDGSKMHEFKSLYGPTLITGFAHIKG